MTQLSSILLAIAGAVAAVILITRVRAALKLRVQKKQAARRRSIEPSISFYLKKSESLNLNKNEMCVKNTGCGKAINVSISDFYHPEEKDWHFKFQGISMVDPNEEKAVDFDFIVDTYKASNKTDQLWMFDPEHDHDFAARIDISYCDIDENVFKRTITIGEDNKNQSSRMQRLQLIQKAMSKR